MRLLHTFIIRYLAMGQSNVSGNNFPIYARMMSTMSEAIKQDTDSSLRASWQRELVSAVNHIIYAPTILPELTLQEIEHDWRHGAACRQGSGVIEVVDIFFGGENLNRSVNETERKMLTRAARVVCGRCAVREMCLAYALEHKEAGIWGGTTEEERKAMRRNMTSV